MPRTGRVGGRRRASRRRARADRIVSLALGIEEPLTDVTDLVCALRLIGHAMDDQDEGRAIVTTAWAATARLDALREAWLAILNAARRTRSA